MSERGGRIRVGCSSWTSEAWWGKVYPVGLAPGDRLATYAKAFDCVEVDSSYYRDPGAFLMRRWARATPDDFLFTMKFPRELTDPKIPLDPEKIRAFESHAAELGSKLGAVVVQMPPWFKPGRATPFLTELLRTLAPTTRYALELRDRGWYEGATWSSLEPRLRDRGIALAWSYLTYLEIPPVRTADFAYLRFIGDHTTVPEATHGEIRVDRSGPLATWAGRVRGLPEEVGPIFAFFNNHFAGFAPESANQLRAALGLAPVEYGRALRGHPTLDRLDARDGA